MPPEQCLHLGTTPFRKATELLGQAQGTDQTNGHGLTVQVFAETGHGLDGVGEGVPKIQQCPAPNASAAVAVKAARCG